MRAVLDPNVLVSAVLSRAGTSARLLRAWLVGDFELVVSPALLDELARVLAYPKIAKRVTRAEAAELLDLLRDHALLVEDPDRVPSIRSPDPGDDYLICLAEESRAALVSGDADLTSLPGRIPVYSPAAFAALLNIPN
ncbi:MAG: putative toxin-antitoxin system toxin component, PIN family [Acidothermus sp.]|nr:putative toxin-antitoxin system toxin component, PIN family [Acidothermus sp.]